MAFQQMKEGLNAAERLNSFSGIAHMHNVMTHELIQMHL
jgi:hypothetical protein